MVIVTLDSGRVVEVDGVVAEIIHALTEYRSRLVPQQGKLKVEINVAGEEVQIKPQPVYVFRRG